MKWLKKTLSIILLFLIAMSGGYLLYQDQFVIAGAGSDPTVILNLTFDEGLYDNSTQAHSLDVNGDASWTDADICKWYGCANFSSTSGDYLNGSWKVDFTHAAVSYWVYYLSEPDGGNEQAAYSFGEGANLMRTQNADYCFNPRWYAVSGEVSTNTADGGCAEAGRWYFVFEQYDGVTYDLWLNGDDYHKESSEPWGDLLHDVGDLLIIGTSGSINLEGYLDELVVYNRSNFTESDVEAMYQAKALGTPPDLDLFVSDFVYEIPWQRVANVTSMNESGDLTVNITIENAGTSNSGSFNYEIYLNGALNDSGLTSVNAGSTSLIQFTFPKADSIFNGEILLDPSASLSEDDVSNNNFSFVIPLTDFPRFGTPLCDSPIADTPSEDSCDRYHADKTSEDFSGSWTAADVDPRAKKGYENAIACMRSDYNMTKEPCQRAYNHAVGWASFDYDDWYAVSVQASHQIMWWVLTVDAMAPVLTIEEIENISTAMYNASFALTMKAQPHYDPGLSPRPNPENGWGFGAGLGVPSYMVGFYEDNPMMILRDDQSYFRFPMSVYWHNRLESFLQGMGNSTEAKYPEGPLYKFYSDNNFYTAIRFLERMNSTTLPSDYETVFDAKAKEILFWALDNNYNGNTLRNDDDFEWRVLSVGDTNSFEDWGSDTVNRHAIITYLGVYASNQSIKDALLYLRMKTYVDEPWNVIDTFLFDELYNSATEQINISGYSFDPLYETIWYRDGFSFTNDCLTMGDYGDSRFSGHPTPKGYAIYCYGEPFVDYVQVPYEDNVRIEVWSNGISFIEQGDSYTADYVEGCSDAGAHQFFGDNDCVVNGSWPDISWVPDNYSGVVDDEYGSSDAFYGVYKTTIPMKDASAAIEQYWVKIGNVSLRRIVVPDSPTGKILDNIINIRSEFNNSVSGDDVTIQRTGTSLYMDVNVLYTNQTLALTDVDTQVQYGFKKTTAPSGLGNYTRLVLQTNTSSVDFVRSYEPYNTTKPFTSVKVGDYFLVDDSKVYFDLDNNGSIDEGSWSTDAWAIAEINDTHFMYAGATYINYNGSGIYVGARSSGITTYEAVADTVSPSFTGVGDLSTTNSSTIIQVNLSEPANLSLDLSNGSTYTESDFSSTQNVPITSLSSNTTYFYNVTVWDLAGNSNTSNNHNFTTLVYETGDCLSLSYYLDLKGVNWTIYTNGTLEYNGCPFISWTPGGGVVVT